MADASNTAVTREEYSSVASLIRVVRYPVLSLSPRDPISADGPCSVSSLCCVSTRDITGPRDSPSV